MRDARYLMQLIGDVFVAEGLGGHVHAPIVGPHTYTYPFTLDDATTQRIKKALAAGPAMEHAVGLPVRIVQQTHILIEIPRETPDIVRAEHLRLTRAGGLQLQIPLGVSPTRQVVSFDFDQHPHLGVFGATNFGKTTLIVAILAQLARYNGPETVRFVFLTFKPGLNGLPYLARTPHTWAVVTDPVEQLQCVQWVDKLIKSNGGRPGQPHTFLVVDDYLSLAMTNRDIGNFVTSTIALARAANWHLILGTQGTNKDSGFSTNTLRNLSRVVFGAANAADAQWLTGRADSGLDKLSQHKGDSMLIHTGDRFPTRLAAAIASDALLQSLARGVSNRPRPWRTRGTERPSTLATGDSDPEPPARGRTSTRTGPGLLGDHPAQTPAERELVARTYAQHVTHNKTIAALWGDPPTPKKRRWLKEALGLPTT